MFRVVSQSRKSKARRGVFSLAHGTVHTPVFMPIATRGAVRSVPFLDIEEAGFEIVLANTYHLFLRPGIATIKKLHGLHRFMNWEKPILTDSGGFQVFSLSHLRKIDDTGVTFRSHLDGSLQTLTPEKSLEIQLGFGVDIAMVLDDVVGYKATKAQVAVAKQRTYDWALRSKTYLQKKRTRNTKTFAIVQGGISPDLRRESAAELVDLNFDGYAIGGLSVGEPAQNMYAMTDAVNEILPIKKPRYLMGVGTPENIVESVKRGVDMFDCVIPTRNARHGSLFVGRRWDARGKLHYASLKISNEKYANKNEPIDKTCTCQTCATTSRAYLRHLFHVGEPLAMYLATIHNLQFYFDLMKEIRQRIKEGKL